MIRLIVVVLLLTACDNSAYVERRLAECDRLLALARTAQDTLLVVLAAKDSKSTVSVMCADKILTPAEHGKGKG